MKFLKVIRQGISNIRICIVSLIVGAVYSCFISFGYNVYQYDHVPLDSYKFWLILLLQVVVLSVIVYVSYCVMNCIVIKSYRTFWIDRVSKMWQYVVFWLIIATCWGVYYYSLWPGIPAYDGTAQLGRALDGFINTHHPITHTYYLVACNSIGELISLEWYSVNALIQGIVMISVFAYLLVKMHEWNVAFWGQFAILIWMCIFPMNPICAMTTTKDVLFAIFLLLFSIFVTDYSIKKDAFFTARRIVPFYFACILVCLFRNNGPIVVAAFFVIWLFLEKKHRMQVLLIAIGVFSLVFLFNGPFTKSLGIEKGNSREAMCMYMQPLARVLAEKGEEIDSEDRELITSIIHSVSGEEYNSRFADPIKVIFDTDTLLSSPRKYVKLYLKLFAKYPNEYVDAFCAMTFGEWYPWGHLPDSIARGDYFAILDEAKCTNSTALYGVLARICKDSTYQKIPILHFFFEVGAIIWVYIWLMGRMVIKKNRELWCLIVPLWAYYGTVLLGPVSLFRYMYPMLICLPTFLFYHEDFESKVTDSI